MKTIFLGLSLIAAMISFSFSANDGDTVNVCTLIDELVTEINSIETISNKTNYMKKLESAKAMAEKANWPMVKENMTSFSSLVNSSSVTTLKVDQKKSLYAKSNSIVEAVNKKKAACK